MTGEAIETADLAVIGAGPAGMGAAIQAAQEGLRVVVLDEQPEPGGQIYRAIERVARERPADLDLLGADYAHGLGIARAFRTSGADYRPGTAVWQIDDENRVDYAAGGGVGRLKARAIVVATGAYERAFPVPGWTLPGVMTAGAAQVALKASGLVPDGRVVVAGAGPLLLLVAAQLAAAGADIVAVLETTRLGDYLNAAPYLPPALGAPEYLRKGLDLRSALKRRGVSARGRVRDLVAIGDGRLRAVRHADGEIDADVLLLHDGVVPNVQLSRQMRIAHEWAETQRYWRPVTDSWGRTPREGLWIAGDGAGIDGARAAECRGRLAALDAAWRLGEITREDRNAAAEPIEREQERHLLVRPLLDHLYPPSAAARRPSDDVTVCRCEEVTAGELRRAAGLGAAGPNQLKAFTRAGMGPCQGRTCGLPVAEILAAERQTSPEEIGYFRIRPPIKPLTLGELAAAASPDTTLPQV